MSTELIPCVCKLVVTRDPKTLASHSRLVVSQDCTRHAMPNMPKGHRGETK